jgi:hypothetical protein
MTPTGHIRQQRGINPDHADLVAAFHAVNGQTAVGVALRGQHMFHRKIEIGTLLALSVVVAMMVMPVGDLGMMMVLMIAVR